MLLVDVQGAETALIEGGLDLLRSGVVRFALVSTHHHSISGDPLTHQRCVDLLVGAGGHVIAEHTVAESFSGDGLVAVSFDERDRDLRVELSRARVGASLFGDPLLDLAACTQTSAERSAELDDVRVRLAAVEHELAVMRATANVADARQGDRVTALARAPIGCWGAGAACSTGAGRSA